MIYGLTRTIAPESAAISPSEVKNYLRIDGADDDAQIRILIEQATEHAERQTGRALVTSTYRVTFPSWPKSARAAVEWPRSEYVIYELDLLLPRTPLVSVTSVKYYAPGETELTTLSSDTYLAITDREQGFVALKSTESWPSLESRPDAVQVVFTAGHGVSATDVPGGIRAAMLLLCRYFYAGGNPNTHSDPENDLKRAERLLEGYRTHNWTA